MLGILPTRKLSTFRRALHRNSHFRNIAQVLHPVQSTLFKRIDSDLTTFSILGQLSKALWSCLKEKNFYELEHSFGRDEELYRDMTLVNFLSNHDIARVATQLKDERQFPSLAHFLLFTVKGVPCIYYGDEFKVTGEKEQGT